MKRRGDGTGNSISSTVVEFREKVVKTLGNGERHRFLRSSFSTGNLLYFGDSLPPDEHVCPESDGMSMTLQDVAGRAVRLTDVEQRQYFRLGLMVTGDVATHLKGRFFVGSLSYVYAHL
jgi:hypothetical protein